MDLTTLTTEPAKLLAAMRPDLLKYAHRYIAGTWEVRSGIPDRRLAALDAIDKAIVTVLYGVTNRSKSPWAIRPANMALATTDPARYVEFIGIEARCKIRRYLGQEARRSRKPRRRLDWIPVGHVVEAEEGPHESEIGNVSAVIESPSAALDFALLLDRLDVERALNALDVKVSEATALAVIHGLTVNEVVERMAQPRSTVADWISKGKAALRAALADEPEVIAIKDYSDYRLPEPCPECSKLPTSPPAHWAWDPDATERRMRLLEPEPVVSNVLQFELRTEEALAA